MSFFHVTNHLKRQSDRAGGPLNLVNAKIQCDGNSLTYGAYSTYPGGATAYPAVLSTLLPFSSNGAIILNKGVNGQTTIEMDADAPTDIDAGFSGYAFAKILVAWEIGNDMFFNQMTANALVNRFITYMTNRKNANPTIKRIAINLPARDNGGGTPAGDTQAVYESKRVSVNNIMDLNWPSWAEGYVNLAATTELGTYNTTYFVTDKIHLSDAGYAFVAQKVKEAILALT